MTVNLSVTVVVGRSGSRHDQLIAKALMVPLGQIMRGIFRHDMAQMLFTEQDDLIETLAAYGAHKSLRVGIQIPALRENQGREITRLSRDERCFCGRLRSLGTT